MVEAETMSVSGSDRDCLNKAKDYDKNFYTILTLGSAASAGTVLPILWEFCEPTSVIDVGCGSGRWVRTAKELGATSAVDVDRNYVEASTLVIPAGDFVAHDLSQPMPHFERFDLALNLEVAGRLPEERADSLIADLSQLSDVVLFSATTPAAECESGRPADGPGGEALRNVEGTQVATE